MNILVTGASGGMGKATCELLIQNGHKVFGLDINEANIPNLEFIKTDITNIDSINDAFSDISKKVDKIDAIVHFAGIYKLNSLLEISEEDFIKIFNINLFGIYRINKIFAPLLQKGSRIIMTSSELAPLNPLPFTGIYAITKSAIEKYAYSLRMEVQLLGIDVVVIRPGAVDTGLLPASTNALQAFCNNTNLYKYNSKRFEKIVNSVETKNIQPSEIAKLTLKILNKKKPKYVYSINRNKLLRLLNILPQKLQNKIIKKILLPPKN